MAAAGVRGRTLTLKLKRRKEVRPTITPLPLHLVLRWRAAAASLASPHLALLPRVAPHLPSPRPIPLAHTTHARMQGAPESGKHLGMGDCDARSRSATLARATDRRASESHAGCQCAGAWWVRWVLGA